MAKDDFDMDFHFDDDDFDPKAFLDDDSEPIDDDGKDIDLSDLDKLLSDDPKDQPEASPSVESDSDLDFSDLGLDDVPEDGEDLDLDDLDLDDILSPKAVRKNAQQPSDFGTGDLPEDAEEPEDVEPMGETPAGNDDPAFFQDAPLEEETEPEQPAEAPVRRREPRPAKERKSARERRPKKPKEAKPNVFTKLYDLYIAPMTNKEAMEAPVDPNNPRRRRRKTKSQIFKEVYLPPILACLCLILILSFVIGAISNAIDQKRFNDQKKQSELDASISAASEAEAERQRILAEAENLAANYDYQGAIDKLDSYPELANNADMMAKRAEYVSTQSTMVEYKDYSQIPNLSFHVLIADPARAFNDQELGGKYNMNFVTTDEFSKILQQLYDNGYVLVDFNDFVNVGQTVAGTDQYEAKSIYLPQGKKPLMLTETMVNYFEYMVDSNKDGTPDAGGAGFANKLVVDANGDIQAEYVDASGNTLIGSYDFVPILEDFIRQHPDFSYRGARAVLAVTGSQGIFGYRCNTSYVSTKGNDYYEQEKAGALAIVEALKAKGYRLACFTYDNDNYRNKNTAEITADLQSWTQQITPIIGNIDTFVFAQASNLSDYTGSSFKAMYQTGFRYFISNDKSPMTEINNTYVRQNRLMVTGETMAWYADRFTDRSLFDPNMVLDMTARGGSVPKAG
ncbi:MAG: hypothetical protein PUD80_05165 [Firmicutes bacterium]|nr:hypothetical protein [Bacillota bacterium]